MHRGLYASCWVISIDSKWQGNGITLCFILKLFTSTTWQLVLKYDWSETEIFLIMVHLVLISVFMICIKMSWLRERRKFCSLKLAAQLHHVSEDPFARTKIFARGLAKGNFSPCISKYFRCEIVHNNWPSKVLGVELHHSDVGDHLGILPMSNLGKKRRE